MEDLLLFAFAFVIIFGGYIYSRMQTPKLPDESALDGKLNIGALRKSPSKLDALAAKASSVGIIKVEPHSRSRFDLPRYEGFVVDINGHPNTFMVDIKLDRVRAEARWLADKLDVPLNDQL